MTRAFYCLLGWKWENGKELGYEDEPLGFFKIMIGTTSMKIKDKDVQKLKEEFYQFRMERAIDELKKEVKKYNKKNTFGNTFASCFKIRKKKKN